MSTIYSQIDLDLPESKVCFSSFQIAFKNENMFSGEKDSRWEPLATSLPTGDVGLEKNTGRDCNDNYL